MNEVTSVQHWESVVSDSFVPLRVRSAPPVFSGAVCSAAFETETAIHRVRSSATVLDRDLSRSDPAPSVLLYTQTKGHGSVSQFSRTAEHGAGEATLYVSDEPYRLSFPVESEGLVAHVPLSRLPLSSPAVGRLAARTIPAQPALRALRSYMREMLETPTDDADSAGLVDTVSYLVDSLLGQESSRAEPASDAVLRIRYARFVERHCASPDTTIAHGARALSVSVRRLHTAFEGSGSSPASVLRAARLALACDLLRTTTMPVSSVAHSAGFTEVSTFHRVFRSERGMTPREHRLRQSDPGSTAAVTLARRRSGRGEGS